MAYTRRQTQDGVTVMNRDLYDNLQDGIEERGVTPQMFGAFGDGIHDDTDAIISALNTYGHCFFPKGTYLITKPITLQARWFMYGVKGSYISNLDSLPILKFQIPISEGEKKSCIIGNGMYHISNLIIESDYIKITHDFSKIGTEENPFTITNLLPKDSLLYGIESIGHCCISECIIRGFSTGIRYGNYHSIKNVTIQNCLYGIQGLTDSTVENLRIQDCDTGLHISGAGATILNVRMDNISSYAILLQSTGVFISNVFADMVGKELLYIYRDAEGCTVTNLNGRCAILSAGRDIMLSKGIGAMIIDGGKYNKIQFNYKHYNCPDGGNYKTPKYLIRSSNQSTGNNVYDIVYEEVAFSSEFSQDDIKKLVYIFSSYPFNSVIYLNGIRCIFNNMRNDYDMSKVKFN